jgi:CarboxypepD_reg-like domain
LKKILISVLCLLPFAGIYGQISGFILEEKSNTPIAYATIVIISKKTGTLTDSTGFFTLKAGVQGDTLVISALGYASDTVVKKNVQSVWRLKPIACLLKEVTVRPDKPPSMEGDKQKKPDTFIGNQNRRPGFQIVRHYKPDCTNCVVSGIQFFIKNLQKIRAPIRIRLYNFDENMQLPGSELLSRSVFVFSEKKNDWAKVELEDQGIVIEDKNGIFIGVEFLSSDDFIALGLSNKIGQQNTFIKSLGSFWHRADFLKDPNGTPLNLMLKVEMKTN